MSAACYCDFVGFAKISLVIFYAVSSKNVSYMTYIHLFMHYNKKGLVNFEKKKCTNDKSRGLHAKSLSKKVIPAFAQRVSISRECT